MREVRFNRSAIEAAQLEGLRKLLAAIVPANRFYTPRVPACIGGIEEFISKTPFTTKSELVEDQLANPPFGSNLTYPLDQYTRYCQTSGTTGNPMRWLDTPESYAWMLDCWGAVLESAGMKAGDRLFFAFSFGPFLGFWTGFEAATRMGCMAIPGGGMRSEARLQAMAGAKVNVLCATPTYALHLAGVARETGFDLSTIPLTTIIVAGEQGGSIPTTRARMEKLWGGARVVDHHGMTEVGPTSYSCPKRPDVLHVVEPAFLPEVIHPDTGKSLKRGETGELVLTNPGRLGSPLLRYRTGDLVKAAAADCCECGSTELALEGGILGRTDDMVVVRGVNVYPSAVEHILRSVGGVKEYRVDISTQRSLTELRLTLEPEDINDLDLAHRIETAFRDSLSLRIPVTIIEPGSLPRFEMKARRWIKDK